MRRAGARIPAPRPPAVSYGSNDREPFREPVLQSIAARPGDAIHAPIGSLRSVLRPPGDRPVALQPAEHLIDRCLPDLDPEPHAACPEPLEQVVSVQRLLREEPQHHDLHLRRHHRSRPPPGTSALVCFRLAEEPRPRLDAADSAPTSGGDPTHGGRWDRQSPGTRSSTTWSKLAVNVLAAVSPIWMRADRQRAGVRRPSWSRSARRRGRGSTSRSSRPFRRARRCGNRCPTRRRS